MDNENFPLPSAACFTINTKFIRTYLIIGNLYWKQVLCTDIEDLGRGECTDNDPPPLFTDLETLTYIGSY